MDGNWFDPLRCILKRGLRPMPLSERERLLHLARSEQVDIHGSDCSDCITGIDSFSNVLLSSLEGVASRSSPGPGPDRSVLSAIANEIVQIQEEASQRHGDGGAKRTLNCGDQNESPMSESESESESTAPPPPSRTPSPSPPPQRWVELGSSHNDARTTDADEKEEGASLEETGQSDAHSYSSDWIEREGSRGDSAATMAAEGEAKEAGEVSKATGDGLIGDAGSSASCGGSIGSYSSVESWSTDSDGQQ